MHRKVVAFGASNSKNSINKQLAEFAAKQVPKAEVEVLDLNDFEMPIYSIDRENESGYPQLAHDFKQLIREADGIVISFAEHNGSYTVAFKNVFDWVSRIEKDVWLNKPLFVLSTSPGGRGGRTVNEQASAKFKRMVDTVVSFILPSFRDNFSETEGILNEELKAEFEERLGEFQAALER